MLRLTPRSTLFPYTTLFRSDARIVMVEAPNNAISFGRINPTCYQPKIVVQNNGTAEITSMKITYKINDGTEATFDWTGSLSYLAKESISLPVPAGFWTTAVDKIGRASCRERV